MSEKLYFIIIYFNPYRNTTEKFTEIPKHHRKIYRKNPLKSVIYLPKIKMKQNLVFIAQKLFLNNYKVNTYKITNKTYSNNLERIQI